MTSLRTMESENPMVDTTVTLEGLLVRSLDDRWERYVVTLKKAQRNPSERLVHDLRVAARRLISSIDLVNTVLSDNRLQGIRAELKNELKGFNPLRDTQVQLLTVGQLLPAFPALQPFHTILLLRERRSIKGIGKRLSRVPLEAMAKDLQAAKMQLGALLTTHIARDIAFAAVLGTATIAFARALGRRRLIDPKDTATIHRLRVAFKKVRYTIEALQPVFAGVTDRQLKAMNAYQQLMGDIQDVEVLRASIGTYATRRHKTRDASLLTVQRDLLQRRDQCVQKFLASADDLLSFWHQKFMPGALLKSPIDALRD